jgi:hypothetical protein
MLYATEPVRSPIASNVGMPTDMVETEIAAGAKLCKARAVMKVAKPARNAALELFVRNA